MSIRFLSASELRLLRSARLDALSESPASFLSTFAAERQYGPPHWRAELTLGIWLIGTKDNDQTQTEALLGATPGDDIPTTDRYLSSLWVTPSARRKGIATRLVIDMVAHLRGLEVPQVWLWVVDGNADADRLYRRLGFRRTGERKRLERDPLRCEERLRLDLSRPFGYVWQP